MQIKELKLWKGRGFRPINFAHLNDMTNAILAGAVLPPVIVNQAIKEIVDGAHRYHAYKKLYGEDYDLDCDLRDFADEKAAFELAVTSVDHGLPFTAYDRRRILIEAEKLGIAIERVADMLKMPVETAVKMIATGSAIVRIGSGQNVVEQKVPLRTSMKRLAGQRLTKAQQNANSRAGMQAENLADHLLRLLDAGLLDWCSESVRLKLSLLYGTLQESEEKLHSPQPKPVAKKAAKKVGPEASRKRPSSRAAS
jgi:ParB-like nuclease domain